MLLSKGGAASAAVAHDCREGTSLTRFGPGAAAWYSLAIMVAPKSGLARPVRDLFSDIWRFGSGAPASLILLSLLMVTLALCAAFPQQPAGLSGSPAQQWLIATAAGYHILGPILRYLGIYNILGGLWLQVLLGAIAYHLLLRAARTGLRAWGALRPADRLRCLPPAVVPAELVTLPADQPQLEKSAARAEASSRTGGLQQDTPGRDALSPRSGAPVEPHGDLRERIQITLEARLGYRCNILVGTPVWTVLYGVRRNWAALAPVSTCVGGLLLLLGLLLNNISGWTASGLALARDIPTEVPQAGGLTACLGSRRWGRKQPHLFRAPDLAGRCHRPGVGGLCPPRVGGRSLAGPAVDRGRAGGKRTGRARSPRPVTVGSCSPNSCGRPIPVELGAGSE